MENVLTKINKIDIVGTLIDIKKVNEGKTKNGGDYISVDFEIKLSDSLEESRIVELNCFSMKLKKDGTISKLYDTYKGLSSLLGKRVSIAGNLRDSVYASEGAISRSTKFEARFISQARSTEEDHATFEVSGFILSPLKETVNRNGDIIDYRVTIGQSNYRGDGVDSYTLSINKDNNSAISYFESSVAKNDSFVLRGDIIQGIEVNEIEIQSDFGAPTTRVYQNKFKRLEVKTGNKISDETSYLEDNINELLAGQKIIEQNILETNKNIVTASKISDQQSTTQKIVQNVL